MIVSVADLGRFLEEHDQQVMSIRRPSEQTKGMWQVSLKKTDSTLHWQRGKLKPTFVEALESCLGVKVLRSDLSDLMQ